MAGSRERRSSSGKMLTKNRRSLLIGLAICFLCALLDRTGSGAEKSPHITSISVPQGGATTIIFHGSVGPFRIQKRASIEVLAAWLDVPDAQITEVQPGVFMGIIPRDARVEDLAFYRVVSERETITDLKGWTVLVQVSAPANRQFFAVGESAVVTVKILDTFAQGITRDDFSTLSLYLYGPQYPQKTVTAVKLLNATADRTKTPHHYIDLKKNPDVQVSGNVLTYPLRPVSDEAPGTYTLSLRSVLAADPIQQVMKFADLQIGSPTVESPVVAKRAADGTGKCAACHEGTISGKMYFRHIDPSGTSKGSWSLDYEPVKSCKSCHNNDGYAAYRVVTATATNRVADPIVRRVHGVHMGAELKLPFNNDPVTGDFRDFVHVEFPADVRNCTKCHLDDHWKTNPSRLACGSCHDDVWFGPPESIPSGMKPHQGGTRLNDKRCWECHDAGGPDDMGIARSVTDAHAVPPPAFKQLVKLELSPPANGKFYAAGEKPKLTVRITDAATGQAINPSSIVEPLISTNVAPNEWRRANLFVSGPRSRTATVLTTAAAKRDPTRSYANNDVRVLRDKTKEDPRVTRTADSLIYQLDDVAKLGPGTYTAYVEVAPASGLGGWAYQNFQVGTTTPEPMVATNCTDCHGDSRMHASSRAVTFTPDICKSCHDYQHQMTGKTSWQTSQYGFGVAPLARRVHGVHFGHYLDKPKEINPGADFSNVIFPQDVRNCTKCHSQSSTWTEKPSRLACLACHDSDYATYHANSMTFDFTPSDPWNGDEIETCIVCHGKNSEFTPKAVHAISDPYVPPYPRAARAE